MEFPLGTQIKPAAPSTAVCDHSKSHRWPWIELQPQLPSPSPRKLDRSAYLFICPRLSFCNPRMFDVHGACCLHFLEAMNSRGGGGINPSLLALSLGKLWPSGYYCDRFRWSWLVPKRKLWSKIVEPSMTIDYCVDQGLHRNDLVKTSPQQLLILLLHRVSWNSHPLSHRHLTTFLLRRARPRSSALLLYGAALDRSLPTVKVVE